MRNCCVCASGLSTMTCSPLPVKAATYVLKSCVQSKSWSEAVFAIRTSRPAPPKTTSAKLIGVARGSGMSFASGS